MGGPSFGVDTLSSARSTCQVISWPSSSFLRKHVTAVRQAQYMASFAHLGERGIEALLIDLLAAEPAAFRHFGLDLPGLQGLVSTLAKYSPDRLGSVGGRFVGRGLRGAVAGGERVMQRDCIPKVICLAFKLSKALFGFLRPDVGLL